MKVIKLHQTENEVIALAKKRDRQAQHSIYNKFSGKMLSVCRYYVKDLQHAEDLMVTGFMKAFTSIDRFEFKGSFEGWLRKIMINESISYLRVNKKMTFLEETFVEEKLSNDFDEKLSADDLQRMVDNLPEGYKVVFNLYAIEGYKHQEIAVMLKISEGTSKSQLSRARQLLQKQINIKDYDYASK